jgi:hypothetical protein
MKGAILAMALLVFVIDSCNGKCLTEGWRGNSYIEVTYPDGVKSSVLTSGGGTADYPDRGFACDRITVVGMRQRSGGFLLFSAAPSTVDLQSPPSSFVLTGQEFMSQYGMPRLEFHDSYGGMVAQATATAVSSDGTWLEVDNPDFSHCYTGTVRVWVINKTALDGSEELIGSADWNAWNRDPTDADGDGWPSRYDCNDSDPAVNPGAQADCTGAYYDRNCDGIADVNQCGTGGGGDGGGGCTSDCLVY